MTVQLNNEIAKIRPVSSDLSQRVNSELESLRIQLTTQTSAAMDNLKMLSGEGLMHCGKTSFIAGCSAGALKTLADLFAAPEKPTRTR